MRGKCLVLVGAWFVAAGLISGPVPAQESRPVLTGLPGKTVAGFGNMPARYIPGRNESGRFVPGMKISRKFVPGEHNLEGKFIPGMYTETGIFRPGTVSPTGDFEENVETESGVPIKLPMLGRDDIERAITDIELIATFEEQNYFIQHQLGNVVMVTSPFGQFNGNWSVDQDNIYCRTFDEPPPIAGLDQEACYRVGFGKGRLHLYTENYRPTRIYYEVWE